MIFGDPTVFAIEAILEPGPEYDPISGNNVTGRIRVWMRGHSVGNFDEPHCWLGPPCQHLLEMSGMLDDLWDPSLSDLTPEQQFDRLDYFLFGARRNASLDIPSDEEKRIVEIAETKRLHRFNFLLHSTEAFDGWKAFLVCAPGSEARALVLEKDSPDVLVFQIPQSLFRDATLQFDRWLRAEEQRLLKRPA